MRRDKAFTCLPGCW